MRLHTLTLCAFGPFPGTERVDFDALSSDGLFLLHGRTGSGKTTVLDAVSFALYGDVPGQRDVGGLHSHHAPEEREPAVELEFTQGDRRWFIRRTPAYRRPSRRGKSKYVSVNQTVLLKVHDGDHWQEVTSGVQAASKEILDILPLDRHQFTQVILLPQGEFAQFLHATSAEKEKLLQKLFDTSLYRRLETELHDRTRMLREGSARAEHKVEVAADGVRSLAQTMVEPALGKDLSCFSAFAPEDLAEAVDLFGAWMERDLRQEAHNAAVSDEAARGHAALLGRHRMLLRLLLEHESRRASHLEQREAVDRCRTELADRHRAVEIERWFDHAETLRRVEEERSAELHRVIGELHHLVGAQDDVDVDGAVADLLLGVPSQAAPEALQRLLIELAQLSGRLLEQDAAQLDQRRNSVQESLATAHRLVADQQKVKDQLQADILGLEARSSELTASWMDLETLEDRRRELTDYVGIHQRRAELAEQLVIRRREHEEAQETVREAINQEQVAADRRRQLLAGHLTSVARRLAADLVPGEPCLVCGAVDHPAPATGTDEPESPKTPADAAVEAAEEASQEAEEITEDDVERATDRLTQAGQTRVAADSALRTAQATVRELAEGLAALTRRGEDHPAAEPERPAPDQVAPQGRTFKADEAECDLVAAALRGAQHRLQEVEEESRRQRERESSRAKVREDLADLRERRGSAQHTYDQALSRREELLAETRRLDEVLTDLRGTHPSVPERLVALEVLRSRCREAESSLARWREADRTAHDARATAQQRLRESAIADVDELRGALLREDHRAEHQHQVETFDREAQRLALVEESEEIVSARQIREQGHTLPETDDVEAAELHSEQAEQARQQSQAAHDRLQDRLRTARDAAEGLTSALQAREEHLAEHRSLAELAATLNGSGPDNPRRMALTSYVLAARLEKVAIAATRHLQIMSEGRYRLLHDDSEKSGRRTGLELKVHDEHSDHERPTSSLSGGETFMAALAMALGLAEVVQAEAGGVGLDTLFIDEGFGSLDEESLDHVMDALHRLQGEGRRVGVVSHVTEMHRAIPTQLRIIRRRTGSTTEMRRPGAIDSTEEQVALRASTVTGVPPGG